MNTVQNPIAKLVGWHQRVTTPKKTEQPKAPSYESVVEQFDKDLSLLQSRDRHAESPNTPSFVPLGPVSPETVRLMAKDTDMRPGEVDVPNVGSLHSTPEGFSLRALQPSRMLPLGMGVSFVGERSRSYDVNKEKGTITVVNTAGASLSSSPGLGAGPINIPAFTESYMIDTKSGTVQNYKKVNLDDEGAVNAGGLISDGAQKS